MSGGANPERGEAALRLGDRDLIVRPSFQALVAAEAELGPLLAMVERAVAGELSLAEIATLIWHCLSDPPGISREEFGEALVQLGLKALTPVLRTLIAQILGGR